MAVFRFVLVLCLCLAANWFTPHASTAAVGLLIPSSPTVTEPDTKTLDLTLGAVNPFFGEGIPFERPQSFTALRFTGDATERTEHLSTLEETTAYGAQAWKTAIALPDAGVYHFIMQSKAIWLPEQDKFVQYVVQVQVPVLGATDGWDKSTGTPFGILPLTRPFGLYEGMSFSGQVILNNAPVPNTPVEIAHLTTDVRLDIPPQDETKKTKPIKRPVPPSPYHAVQIVKTDAAGQFTFACPFSGWWSFSSTATTGDPLQDPEGNLKPVETKTIFWVWFDKVTAKNH